MKWALGTILLILVLLAGGVFMANKVWAPDSLDTTDIVTGTTVSSGEIKEFKQLLEEEVRIKIGQPIEGYEPGMFLAVFPGLEASDFDGVKAQMGEYVYRGEELVHEIGETEFVHSAAGAVSEEGIKQLLENVLDRLGIEDNIVELNYVMDKLQSRGDIESANATRVEVYKGISFASNEKVIDLSHRNLEGSLKAEIRLVTGLQELDVSNNNFTGLPAEVGQLSELRILNLANNSFTGLPHELGNLTNLKVLNLTGNDISTYDLDIISGSLPATTRIITDETSPVACTMDAKMCPDGSYVGRTGPNCEFAACPVSESVICTEEMKSAEACIDLYAPVCGLVQVQCITTPCNPIPETFSNGCYACAQGNVISYTEGACQ